MECVFVLLFACTCPLLVDRHCLPIPDHVKDVGELRVG
jgi:hypothetical protein